MSRRKSGNVEKEAMPDHRAQSAAGEIAVTESSPPPPAATESAEVIDPEMLDDQPRAWAPPYKALFTSTAKGFEMSEDYRFRQRVFKFAEKPDEATLAALKAAGFRYRAAEKSWTIQADATTRRVADELARTLSGGIDPTDRSR
jgi:hypothetical protein